MGNEGYTAGEAAFRSSAGPHEEAYVEARLDEFLALSEVLVAKRGLSRAGGRAFFRILLEATPRWYGNPSFDPVLDAGSEAPPLPLTMDVVFQMFRELSAEAARTGADLETLLVDIYYQDIILGAVIRNLIIVWYNGALGATQAPAEAYTHTLVWDAISAWAPGIPGPYFGSWAYPPPAPISDPSKAGPSGGAS